MTAMLSVLTAILIVGSGVGLPLAMWLAARSFWDQRADYVRHFPPVIARHPERTGIDGLEEIAFAGADRQRLAGWYAPPANGAAIVLVHGTGAERSSLLFETKFLAAAGFGVLALDLPGQGASAGRTRWGVPERAAIGAAVDWLSARPEVDPRRIGGFGLSMGAYVLTQAAALDERLRAVTLVSSPRDVVEHNWQATRSWGLLTQVPCYLALRAYGQSLGMKPGDVIGAIAPRAVFVIAGARDTLVPKLMMEQLFAAAGEPKELWIAPHARHADLARAAGPEYRARVSAFFARALTAPTTGSERR